MSIKGMESVLQEEVIAIRGKELETFLKCLESYPLNTKILKEKTVMAHTGGDTFKAWWWDPTTKESLLDFLLNKKNHKVDGTTWCNGFLGSRWADTKLNGKMCRIQFYTRKNDPDMFCDDNVRAYLILIDPTYFD